MPRLTDTQLVILSAACQRVDRSVFPVTAKVTGGALDKVLNSLLAKALIEEVPAGRNETVWRTDDAGSRFTLRATDAACEALGIAEGTISPEPEGKTRTVKGSKTAASSTSSRVAKGKGKAATARPAKGAPAKAKREPGTRTGTKQEKLIAMLRRKDGTTVDEVVKALGWQPHTVRGVMAGALKKKLKLKIASEKVDGRGRVYRIAD